MGIKIKGTVATEKEVIVALEERVNAVELTLPTAESSGIEANYNSPSGDTMTATPEDAPSAFNRISALEKRCASLESAE